jgi:hypothetical protein
VLRFFTGRRRQAALLASALFLLYNADGKDAGGGDSQPTKFSARSLVLRHTLSVDDDVAKQPLYAERAPFQRDLQGHYRSAYSPIAALFGGITAQLLSWLGADLDAPFGPNLIAALTASALVAAAVALVFLTLTRVASTGVALAVAVGLGLGTNWWGTFAKSLGQHEVVAFGLALMLFAWLRPVPELTTRRLLVGAAGLALAVTARFQIAPLVAVLLFGLLMRVGFRRALVPATLVTASLATLFVLQYYWFGHIFGAMPRLEALHPDVHGVSTSISRTPWVGAAGMLISPNRGLFVFSPIALVAILGIPALVRRHPTLGAGWALIAALVQFLVYSCYSVWWGGFSYGPRYVLDVVVLLTPAAAVALMTSLSSKSARTVTAVALAWSIVVAATDVFRANTWNARPLNVDQHHERLWDWRDLQIVRGWQSGWDSRNYSLFSQYAWRRPAGQ